MTDCRRARAQLSSYVDRLLPGPESADLERHLAQCPPCREDARREAAGRAVLREHAGGLRRLPLPPGLQARCQALAREHAARAAYRTRGGRVLGWAAAAAASLVLAVVLLQAATRRFDMLLAAQLTADHAVCFLIRPPSGTGPADAVTIQRTLAEEYGWHVHVPPSSAAAGVQLVGVRRCYSAEGALPHILYRIGGQNVSLYMVQGIAHGTAEMVTFGHRSHMWSRDGVTYVVVSGAGGDEVSGGADYLRQQLQQ